MKMKEKNYTKVKKNRSFIFTFLRIVSLLQISSIGLAAGQSSLNLGDLSDNVFNIGLGVCGIIQAVCVIAGISLVLGSVLQYKRYRQNPIEVRLSTVITGFVTGIALIILEYIPMQINI
jgi:hypothetical protein